NDVIGEAHWNASESHHCTHYTDVGDEASPGSAPAPLLWLSLVKPQMVEQMPRVNRDGFRRPKGTSGLDGVEYPAIELLGARLARFGGQVHSRTRALPTDHF